MRKLALLVAIGVMILGGSVLSSADHHMDAAAIKDASDLGTSVAQLIEYGRAQKDPLSLVVAARMINTKQLKVAKKEKADSKELKIVSADDLLSEALAMSKDDATSALVKKEQASLGQAKGPVPVCIYGCCGYYNPWTGWCSFCC